MKIINFANNLLLKMDLLPHEILLHIFDKFGRDDLKNILNVCELWRDLVLSSSVLMRKLPLSLNKEWIFKIEFMQNSGEFVKELKMEYCTFESINELKNILKLTPNIEILRMCYVYIKQPPIDFCTLPATEVDEEITKFSNLKVVDISSKFWGYITQIDQKILRYLKNSQIEHLNMKLPMQRFSSDFIEFLCQQKSL